MYADHHHDDRLAFWCAAPPGAQTALVGSDPGPGAPPGRRNPGLARGGAGARRGRARRGAGARRGRARRGAGANGARHEARRDAGWRDAGWRSVGGRRGFGPAQLWVNQVDSRSIDAESVKNPLWFTERSGSQLSRWTTGNDAPLPRSHTLAVGTTRSFPTGSRPCTVSRRKTSSISSSWPQIIALIPAGGS